MEDTLIVYFPPGEELIWCRRGDTHVVHGVVQDALADAGGSDIIVVLAGESVTLAQAELPPIRQASRRLQATRYALEDQLASPVDRLHFALGARAGGGVSPVAVIDEQYLRETLESFGTARRQIIAVVVDAMCMPAPEEDACRLRLVDDRALVRANQQRGFACELPLLPTLLASGGLRESQLHITAQEIADHQQQIEALQRSGYTIELDTVSQPYAWLGEVSPQSGINLLQGAYAPSNPMDDTWRPLKMTAALAGVWLGTALFVNAAEYIQLQQRYSALQSEARDTFKQAFPQVQNINDIRVQAEQGLRELQGSGSGGGLLPLLGATAVATNEAQGLEVQSLQFRDGALTLSLRGKDIQALEGLRTSFGKQPNAQLNVESADAASEGVQIRARITGAGA